jgi:heme/copper-type cytochrome/quinol oxidase subunit 1
MRLSLLVRFILWFLSAVLMSYLCVFLLGCLGAVERCFTYSCSSGWRKVVARVGIAGVSGVSTFEQNGGDLPVSHGLS